MRYANETFFMGRPLSGKKAAEKGSAAVGMHSVLRDLRNALRSCVYQASGIPAQDVRNPWTRSQRQPPEKMMLLNVRFNVLLVKSFISAPGSHVIFCPTLTAVSGMATQVFVPVFSRQT